MAIVLRGTKQRSKTRHKYNTQRVEYDGINFDSKLEGDYYLYLKKLKQCGEVVQFLRQVPFHLPGNTRCVVDFQVFWADGNVEFIDVKGRELDSFIKNKKQVEDLYNPIKIKVVKRGDF